MGMETGMNVGKCLGIGRTLVEGKIVESFIEGNMGSSANFFGD